MTSNTQEVNVSPVFIANAKALKSKKYRIIVNQGGTRSGKTYSICQLFDSLAQVNSNLEFSITSESMPHLRRGALKDFLNIKERANTYNESNHNKTNQVYKYDSGSKADFFSVDDSGKVRGSGRDYCFINEANLVSYDTYYQLLMRTRKTMILDYNPSEEFHWIYEKVLPRDDVKFIQSTYLDNWDFLPKEQIKEIERMQELDPNYWRVYGLGERGMSQEKIYTHYKIIKNFPDLDWFDDYCFGLDFGYNNPTALVLIGEKDQEYYWKQIMYESGLNNNDLIDRLSDIDIIKDREIYCDTNEPDKIDDLKKAGFIALKAYKGEKSVKDGIDYIRGHKLHIDYSSIELVKEVRNYKYKLNKDGFKDEKPVKINDHAMDAARYGQYTHWGRVELPSIRSFI